VGSVVRVRAAKVSVVMLVQGGWVAVGVDSTSFKAMVDTKVMITVVMLVTPTISLREWRVST